MSAPGWFSGPELANPSLYARRRPHLSPHGIGCRRPLTDIRADLVDDALLATAKAVLDSAEPRGVQRCRPWPARLTLAAFNLTAPSMIGSTGSFWHLRLLADVSRPNSLQRNSEASPRAVVDTVREPLIVLDDGSAW